MGKDKNMQAIEKALALADKVVDPLEQGLVKLLVLSAKGCSALAEKASPALADLNKIKNPLNGHVAREELVWALATPVLLLFMLVFSRVFPPATAIFSGAKLYTNAWFSYDSKTKFDDTILTWGTDFVIAAVMGAFTFLIVKQQRKGNEKLVLASALLIGSYSLSTFAGALGHMFFPKRLNTFAFRFVWRICVGSVAAAGGFMGAGASEIAAMQDEGAKNSNFGLVIVPHFVWVSYTVFFTLMNFVGFYSMARPACDIFLVGVTQTPSTLYLVLALYARNSWENHRVSARTRRIFVSGALLNIVLLPLYDVLAAFAVPLGITNVILHTTLLLSWGSQAYGLLEFCKISHSQQKREKAE